MRPLPTARQLSRALDRHRALVAGGLAAAAVAVALGVLAPTPPTTVTVLAAAHDLRAGAQVADDDVRTVELPVHVAPDQALRSTDQALGRVLAGPVRAGEPLTDVRLLGAGLVPPGGQVAVPLRVAEPALPLLVAAGDRVDVLATSLEGAEAARAVVTAVSVLAVPTAEETADGALLVVAASPSAAARLAAAAVTSRLSVAVHGR